jgi:hypothetical protein
MAYSLPFGVADCEGFPTFLPYKHRCGFLYARLLSRSRPLHKHDYTPLNFDFACAIKSFIQLSKRADGSCVSVNAQTSYRHQDGPAHFYGRITPFYYPTIVLLF